MHPTKARCFVKHWAPTFFFISLMYGHMMFWIRFSVSFSFLLCYKLKQSLLEIQLLVTICLFSFIYKLHRYYFTTHQFCLYDCYSPLSLSPFRATFFEFFSAIVTFSVGTYFEGVWSKSIINSLSMFDVTSKSTISYKYCVRTCNHIDLVVVGRDVITIRQDRYISL